MQAARDAQHKVGTHERLRRSSKCAEGVQVVVIDEAPETVLAPTLHISVSQVTPVETLAHAIRHHWYSEATADQKSFAGALLDVVAAIHAACADITTAGVRRVDLVVGHQVPQHWQRLLFESVQQVGVTGTLDADALVLVTKAAAGELSSLEIVTDLTAKGRLMHFVVGGWRPTLPTDAAVVCLDATGDAADIAAVVGRPVVDCTPSGHLPLAQPVVQITDDISRRTASSTVAGMVEAFLASHPEVQRLGIIGHRQHIHDLVDGGLLSEPARARLVKWCYFGQGPDRGSNDWHQTTDGSPACDHLLRLGTPRANPGDYRRWLVQHGLHDAAGKVDGDWGRRDWEAVTVDGTAVTVPGAGYSDPDWHRAYTAVSRAAGRQADGRGRAILADGIPVTILSNEPGPYPIAPSLTTTPAAIRETVEIVRSLACQQPLPLIPPTAKNPIGNTYRENCSSQPIPAADCLAAIMAAAGINQRAAFARLADCRKAGLLAQPKRGWYALPDSPGATATDLPAPVARPEPQPTPPAVVQSPVQAVVIAAVGPVIDTPSVDVVAVSTPETTTATCTSTASPTPGSTVDDMVALADERAAILEFDAQLDRETADRLAREMVLGRDATTPPVDPPDDIVVSVDHAGLAARAKPYVRQALGGFAGTVRVIGDRDDPFAGRRGRAAARRPGQCQCGHDDAWKRVPIHGGQSVRIDCGHCDRFGWFAVWHGQRLPGPAIDDPPPRVPAKTPGPHRLSFVPVPPAAPVGMVLAPAC
jgi:hypothetical protein